MTDTIAKLDGRRVTDLDSFHGEFVRLFGFPDWYGRNQDAWIDLMTYLDEEDGTRSITIPPGRVLTIQVDNYRDLKARCPQLVDDLVEAAAFVNWRRIELGRLAILALSFYH